MSPGKPLFTLVDDDPLKIELSVPEAEVRAIKEGQDVELVAVAAPDKVAKAKITRIGAEIGRTRSLIVEARIDPGSGLVPGMFAEARITTGEAPRPGVPKDAVVKRGKTWHAFVFAKGEAVDRIVQIAPAGGSEPGRDRPGRREGREGEEDKRQITKVTEQIADGRSVAE